VSQYSYDRCYDRCYNLNPKRTMLRITVRKQCELWFSDYFREAVKGEAEASSSRSRPDDWFHPLQHPLD
jgi:hypothetical protein